MGEMTMQWHCRCVTIRGCHEGPGSLEEQMVDVLLFESPDCHGVVLRCTY